MVAEEGRNLAQMSENSAKDTNGIIDHSVSKVQSIIGDTKNRAPTIIEGGKLKVAIGMTSAGAC